LEYFKNSNDVTTDSAKNLGEQDNKKPQKPQDKPKKDGKTTDAVIIRYRWNNKNNNTGTMGNRFATMKATTIAQKEITGKLESECFTDSQFYNFCTSKKEQEKREVEMI
jgi:hypothetical protein